MNAVQNIERYEIFHFAPNHGCLSLIEVLQDTISLNIPLKADSVILLY